jgi:hypothetical protein
VDCLDELDAWVETTHQDKRLEARMRLCGMVEITEINSLAHLAQDHISQLKIMSFIMVLAPIEHAVSSKEGIASPRSSNPVRTFVPSIRIATDENHAIICAV